MKRTNPGRRASLKKEAPNSPSSVRGQYERLGVETFYARFGATYRNPHEPAIREGLERAVELWRPDLSRVLDLAAGSGEATLALHELGAGHVDGIDPFTADAYAARTGRLAEKFSFADIAGGALAGRRYSLVVCSFAMHLCEPSRLPGLAQQLSLIAPSLLILTPHKRLAIQREWGWDMVGEVVVQRVRVRLYRSVHGAEIRNRNLEIRNKQ